MERLFFKKPLLLQIILLLLVSMAPLLVNGQLPSDQLFRKGYFYLGVDREKAIQYLSEAIDRDSSRAKYFYFRGIAKFKLGNYEQSVTDFAKSVELDTTLKISYMYQGLAYKNLGDFEQAGELIDEYIHTNGADSSGYVYAVRGKTRMEAGDLQGALEDFSHLTEYYPQNEQNHYYKMIVLSEKGDLKAALGEVNLLVEQDPDFYGYYFYRGNLYFNMGNFPRAIQDFTTSISYNNKNADAYFSRGVVLDTLRRHQEAIDNFTMAIALNSEDGVYFSRRGNSRFNLGNKEGACLDWTIAGNLGYYEDYDKVKRLCE